MKLEKLGTARVLGAVEKEKESTQEEVEDSDGSEKIGPKCNISLLDQHSKLKQEAQGWTNSMSTLLLMIIIVIIIYLFD